MRDEDWYSRAFSAGGGGHTADEQRELNHFQHMWAVYPLTEAHVLLTCAATGLIRGRVSLFNGA